MHPAANSTGWVAREGDLASMQLIDPTCFLLLRLGRKREALFGFLVGDDYAVLLSLYLFLCVLNQTVVEGKVSKGSFLSLCMWLLWIRVVVEG